MTSFPVGRNHRAGASPDLALVDLLLASRTSPDLLSPLLLVDLFLVDPPRGGVLAQPCCSLSLEVPLLVLLLADLLLALAGPFAGPRLVFPSMPHSGTCQTMRRRQPG